MLSISDHESQNNSKLCEVWDMESRCDFVFKYYNV